MKRIFFGVFFWSLVSLAGQAYGYEYRLVRTGSDFSDSFKFSIGYTLGTHRGKAARAEGQLTMTPDQLQNMKGSLRVPISSMRTGNDPTRDCHMRESLGLNYALSEFPEKHVCDSHDLLPGEGRNSIHYPFISFTIQGAREISRDRARPGWVNLVVEGIWDIHGKKVKKSHPLSLKFSGENDSRVSVEGDFTLLLSEFDVQVKNATVLGFTIRTEDKVHVKLNLVLGRP